MRLRGISYGSVTLPNDVFRIDDVYTSVRIWNVVLVYIDWFLKIKHIVGLCNDSAAIANNRKVYFTLHDIVHVTDPAVVLFSAGAGQANNSNTLLVPHGLQVGYGANICRTNRRKCTWKGE